ncbi:MAG TPA: cysteine desulfurase [Planctomycetes bacterium]|nr:cysteine desulfurase [Planctomycetota bacterium]
MESIYLDHAATTPIAPEVRRGMAPMFEAEFANPSSRHGPGVRVREAIEAARARVARSISARPEQVVFTSGGTEANNLAVLGLARAGRGKHVLVGPTEHASVREAAKALVSEGFEVETLALDERGDLDIERLVSRLRPDTVVVACMLVNNEFGTVSPIPRIAKLVRANAPNARVHVDAVQGLGKLPVSFGELGAHTLAISAHKVHGPKGTGALVVEDGTRLRPLVFGGGQERGLRTGTENAAGIVGFSIAVELAANAQRKTHAHLSELRALLADELAGLAGARLLDVGSEHSPAIAALSLPGPPAEVWMHHLEERGVHTSVGSACQGNRGGIPPALLALGFGEEEARHILRMSFSSMTTAEEVRAGAAALRAVASGLGVKP